MNEILKNLELVAFAKINDQGDLFDLRLQNNYYEDQTKIVPLFRFKNLPTMSKMVEISNETTNDV